MPHSAFTLSELGNTYADANNRYIVSLIVGYDDHEAASPIDAAAHALALTQDDDAADTHWYFFDRQTSLLHLIEQLEAENVLGNTIDPDFNDDADDESEDNNADD